MDITDKLRELLIPVFGLTSIEEVKPEHSLVKDLGATSIDFVEISYLIEGHFNVVIKTNELMIGGTAINPDELFVEGILTQEGASILNANMNGDKFVAGNTRRDLYESITVADLAYVIKVKSEQLA